MEMHRVCWDPSSCDCACDICMRAATDPRYREADVTFMEASDLIAPLPIGLVEVGHRAFFGIMDGI